jgi:tetratricopeptide (TPR) repeat protein
MRKHRPAGKSSASTLKRCLLLSLLLAIPIQALSQTAPEDKAERRRALQLYEQNKFADAIPLLEKLVQANPSDVGLLERLGWSTFVVSGSMKDKAARKQARARALQFLNRAKDLGDNSDLLRLGLEGLSQPDTTDAPLSAVNEADAALREGEAAHARGDLDNAIKGYKCALELDPKLYLAPLFIGDMYFKKGHQASDPATKKQLMQVAGEWFARAIAIDENVETAYRYWGDALMAVGDEDGAKARFIDAIIAEPFNRNPYMGLSQWSNNFKVNMSHPEIKQPATSDSKTTVVIDSKNIADRTPEYYWSFYDLTRANYKTARFEKDHPGEKAYRHSLAEEAAALRMVAGLVSKDQDKLKTMDPSLENLLMLYKADLIEAYVFFVRRDEDIARDYADYRKANRDKLRRYWNDVVIARQRGF